MEPLPGQAWISQAVFWQLPPVRAAVAGSETARLSLRSFLQQRGLLNDDGLISVAGAGAALSQWRRARGKRSTAPRPGPVRRRINVRGSWEPGTGRFTPWRDDDDCA